MSPSNRSSLARARAALTRIFEPSDLAGLALVQALGPEDAWSLVMGNRRPSASDEQQVGELLSDAGAATNWTGISAALERWAPRRSEVAPDRDLAVIQRLGGGLLIPEDDSWPAGLADLGLLEPLALWVRSAGGILPPLGQCISVVGSRDSTAYGSAVTGELAYGLAQRGFTVISGGAYGIDAHAHRAALAVQEAVLPTIAVMAGGLDRYYPAGNEELLRTVAQRGALVAEVPPGSNPTRYRFLQRNRLIAALSAVTVVVEARWRSGALSTAHHAEQLSRIVGTVPGSVYSANSAGCHRLLREGSAVCVTDASEVAELAGAPGVQLATEKTAGKSIHDGLTVEDLLLLDALPVRAATTVEKLTSVAGLGASAVLAGLGRLELSGLAVRAGAGWRRGKGEV